MFAVNGWLSTDGHNYELNKLTEVQVTTTSRHTCSMHDRINYVVRVIRIHVHVHVYANNDQFYATSFKSLATCTCIYQPSGANKLPQRTYVNFLGEHTPHTTKLYVTDFPTSPLQ